MKIEQFEYYLCVVRPRSEHNGCKLKPKVKDLEGQLFTLQAAWYCDEDSLYNGEWALTPINQNDVDMFVNARISWIGSGDVEIIGKVGL